MSLSVRSYNPYKYHKSPFSSLHQLITNLRGGKQAVGGGPGGPTEAHNTGGGTNNDAVDFFYRSRGLHGLFTQIELSLSASKLRDRDITSKSDPMAVAYVKKRDGTLEEIGRTEVIMNSLNPAWIVKVSIAYQFEIVQPLVFHVYDVDNHNVPVKMLKLNELDFLGKASCDLSEIMTKQNRTLTLNLHDKSIVGVSRNLGTLSVYAEETVASRSAVEISFRCSHLANVDLLSKSSDPMADVYVRMRKPNVANGKEGVGRAKPDGGKPSECGTSRTSEKKRKRKPESEFSTSSDEDEDVDLAAQNIGLNTGNPTRRSSRQKQNVPYNENKNDDDDFVSPAKRSKPSNVSEGEVNEAGAGKDKDDATTLQYPDPEFSDFDKDRAEHCFAVNQLWAIYDTCDGMPRFYARIKKVFSPFKLQITWLEADPDDESENDWCEEDLPVACGKFMNGSTEGTEDRLMFSHQISFIESAGRNSFWIYPKKGETWALFKDWDIKRSSDPEKHKPPYRYEFVEVVADFNKDDGIVVAYLGKVKGFVSIFQRIAKNGVVSFRVAPRELYRFSHQIPSFRMTGKEREGVPEGSFELDPASLPTNPD